MRSYFTGDLSSEWSMRKCGRESRTAVWSSTGMLTRPNAMEPFQIGRGMQPEPAKRRPGLYGLAARAERAFSVDPIVEVVAVLTAALEVFVIRGLSNLFVAWDGCAVADLRGLFVRGVTNDRGAAVGLRDAGGRCCSGCA